MLFCLILKEDTLPVFFYCGNWWQLTFPQNHFVFAFWLKFKDVFNSSSFFPTDVSNENKIKLHYQNMS